MPALLAKGCPIRAEIERLGLTPSGLQQLARGVAGGRIGGGQARLKLIEQGYAAEGEYCPRRNTRTFPTDKGREAIARLRKLGW